MGSIRELFVSCVLAIVGVVVLSTLLGLLDSLGWFFELFVHFKAHYLALALILFVLIVVLRVKSAKVYIGLAFCVLINAYFILPFYFSNNTHASASAVYHLVALNLSINNNQLDLVEEYLQNKEIDFLVLPELTPEFEERLKEALKYLPFSRTFLSEHHFGIGFYSKHEVLESKLFFEEKLNVPGIVAKINSPSGPLEIFAIHPFPPVSPDGRTSRDSYLKKVALAARNSKLPKLICGDFNATPWTKSLVALKKGANLRLPKGFGLLQTWPSRVGIPIDHCLLSDQVEAVKYTTGSYVGSDHLPIELTFTLSPN